MLYIVRVIDDGEVFDYEYGNIKHTLEHYVRENTATIIEYNDGKETILRRKINGEEQEV